MSYYMEALNAFYVSKCSRKLQNLLNGTQFDFILFFPANASSYVHFNLIVYHSNSQLEDTPYVIVNQVFLLLQKSLGELGLMTQQKHL